MLASTGVYIQSNPENSSLNSEHSHIRKYKLNNISYTLIQGKYSSSDIRIPVRILKRSFIFKKRLYNIRRLYCGISALLFKITEIKKIRELTY
jgi:hypothetical protein